MIRIDPDVFTYQEELDYSKETIVVTGFGGTDRIVEALKKAGRRFMLVDETGTEHPDHEAAEAAYTSGSYTPNYCSQPTVTDAGVEMYLDCKGAIEKAMADTLRQVLREELEAGRPYRQGQGRLIVGRSCREGLGVAHAAIRALVSMSGHAEPPAGRVRPMGMPVSLRLSIALVACSLVTACSSGEVGVSSGDGDCTSQYDVVADGPTWPGLRRALLDSEEWGPVARLRVLPNPEDLGDGHGQHDIVRVVDLLNERGRRIVFTEVWRTDSGGWRAGVWSQCID